MDISITLNQILRQAKDVDKNILLSYIIKENYYKMYNIIFYRDRKGNELVKEYILSLFRKDNKDNRIKRGKIQDYINILKDNGMRAGEPFVKHLDGEIWELRPLNDRILFFAYFNNTIVLLTHFKKATRKTPKREIEKAKRCMQDFLERMSENEQSKI